METLMTFINNAVSLFHIKSIIDEQNGTEQNCSVIIDGSKQNIVQFNDFSTECYVMNQG